MRKFGISIATVATLFLFTGCSSTTNGVSLNHKEKNLVGTWDSNVQKVAISDGSKVVGNTKMRFFDNKTMRNKGTVTIQNNKGNTIAKFRLTSDYMWSTRGDNLNLNLIKCEAKDLRKPKGAKAEQVSEMLKNSCKYVSNNQDIKNKTIKVQIDDSEENKIKVNKKVFTKVENAQ